MWPGDAPTILGYRAPAELGEEIAPRGRALDPERMAVLAEDGDRYQISARPGAP